MVMNLSGKKTRIGRNSGERYSIKCSHQRGKLMNVANAKHRCNFQVQGQRISLKGFICLFFALIYHLIELLLIYDTRSIHLVRTSSRII